MNNINRLLIPFILLLGLSLTSCQQDSAQQQYEAEAYGPIEGYTQTDLQQNVLSQDKKDWQVSPYYQGLIRILPLFPNPISYGGTAYLEMTLNGAPIQSYVELGYLNFSNQWIPLQQETVSSEFELVTFVIDSRNFGSSAELAVDYIDYYYTTEINGSSPMAIFLLNNPVSNKNEKIIYL